MFTPSFDIVMTDFEECKHHWYSPPFYSHSGECNMCHKICANGVGEGKGTHVAVFLSMMRGEFDDNLMQLAIPR